MSNPLGNEEAYVGLARNAIFAGWADMWRHPNPDTAEYTWYSRRAGAPYHGFLANHAFAAPILRARATAYNHSHVERDAVYPITRW